MQSHTPSRMPLAAGSLIALVLASIPSMGWSATFESEDVAPELGVHVFDRGVAEREMGRELFGTPYASVVVGNVDVYDVFPYVESRYFVVVSDPEWNRLVVTATGSGKVTAWSGTDAPGGALTAPRGLAVDESGNVYVCDSGNDRVLVLRTSQEFDKLELTPVGEIAGVSRPYGVAVSDGGTPFDPADDRVYVAEAGRNQVSRFARTGEASFARTGAIGGLGSGVGRFAGPMAVAVGRDGDHSTDRVYVADAHNRRLVELVDDGESLAWGREVHHDGSLVTGLESDRFGQIYAVAPFEGRVSKWSKELEVLAVDETASARPRSFHVPFVTTTDHRNGTKMRAAEGRGLLVEEWGDRTGVQAWSLGVELKDLTVTEDRPLRAQFLLTDAARVEARLEDSAGRTLARRDLGLVAAGSREVTFAESELGPSEVSDGSVRWVLEARSTYADRTPVVATTNAWVGELGFPSTTQFQGTFPNPFLDQVALRFSFPSGKSGVARVDVFDLSGRRVRTLAQEHDGGPVDVLWDGRDDRGHELGSGVYFYRVHADDRDWEGRVVRLR
ncbi:MAG: FlgD immunoglobulin-like domain containing protein [Candidatus Eisenbacteria bacterium]